MGVVARQASWNTVLTMVGMGLGFLNMSLLFPRHLTPDEFGFTRLVVSIAVVAAQIAQFGGETTVIRYFPYFRDARSGHRGLFGLWLGVATAGAFLTVLVLGVFHPLFSAWFNDTSGLYQRYGLVVLPLVFAEVYFLLLRGFSRSVHRSIAPVFAREFLLRVLQTALILAHTWWHLPLGVFLDLYVGTFVLTTAVLLFDLVRAGEFKLGLGSMRVGRNMRRSMTRYSLFTFGSGLASIAVGSIDQVMVGAMLHDGLAYVAYYAVAVFLASLIMVPARVLVLPLLPIMADAWRKRDHGKIGMLYHRTASIQLVVSAFLLLLLWVNLQGLYTYLKPSYYTIGAPVLSILGVANVINLSTGLSGSIVSTSRSYWFDAVSGAVLIVLNVLFDYLFIKWWGVNGAAWSSLLCMLIVTGWRVIFLHRKFGLWPYDGMTVRAVLVILAVGAVMMVLPHAGPPLVDIGWRSVALVLLYWPAVHLLRIAPELGMQVRKVLDRSLQGIPTGRWTRES